MHGGTTENRPSFLRFVSAFFVSTAAATAVVAWVMWALGHSHPAVGIVLFVAIVVYTAVIAWAAFRWLWNPMLAPYPPRTPAQDAVHRRFQSFGLGIVNMGGSVHVAADDSYLHLTPLSIWRAMGARKASIPWSAMRPVGRQGRAVMVGSQRLVGPKWCLSLASPASVVGGSRS